MDEAAKKFKVVAVTWNLPRGGTEGQLSTVVNSLATCGISVRLITLGNAPLEYNLHPRIQVEQLGLVARSSNPLQALVMNVKRIFALRRAIIRQQPAVLLSFQSATNVLSLLAARGTGIPVVVREVASPWDFPKRPAWRTLRSIAYRWAAKIVSQTDAAAQFFQNNETGKVCVIPNSVLHPPWTPTIPRLNEKPKTIVALARLSVEKGIDLLLEAFQTVHTSHPQVKLEIWGTGPLKDDLSRLAERLGISENVAFRGPTVRPYDVLRHADLLVCSSRSEGFPNVIAEAMACGVPVVSFDCPQGPRALIQHEQNGLLAAAENVEDLAACMQRMLDDANLRHRLAQEALSVSERFSAETICGTWENLLHEVAHK